MYKVGAIFTGVIIAIMISLNGMLANGIGNYLAVFIIHITGAVGVLMFLMMSKKKINIKKHIPLYLFSGGALGVIIVIFNNLCFKYLGMSLTLSLGLAGQSIAACIIDHFGLFGMNTHKFQKEKLIGYGVVIGGIVVMTVF
ncbi:DMT family transporter [Anaeromicrobium sediminis]|uniref:EamA-like transporter family protein n=1 Tax=Anaeromicrobium sediminis TaxID=1478221 RepID=A0A267MLN4_9FIRM|nr:DMT family transporter [Anaeromicrobium sediminis]PAB59680.1 hypothetical protein CCE28_08935 [Anaeromicrobium sediminis]